MLHPRAGRGRDRPKTPLPTALPPTTCRGLASTTAPSRARLMRRATHTPCPSPASSDHAAQFGNAASLHRPLRDATGRPPHHRPARAGRRPTVRTCESAAPAPTLPVRAGCCAAPPCRLCVLPVPAVRPALFEWAVPPYRSGPPRCLCRSCGPHCSSRPCRRTVPVGRAACTAMPSGQPTPDVPLGLELLFLPDVLFASDVPFMPRCPVVPFCGGAPTTPPSGAGLLCRLHRPAVSVS